MSDNRITFIILVISGIIWGIKKIIEKNTVANAQSRSRESNNSDDYFADDAPFFLPEEEEKDYFNDVKSKPELPPEGVPMQKYLPDKISKQFPAPLEDLPVTREGFAATLRQNAAQALVMQEILNPPKGLR